MRSLKAPQGLNSAILTVVRGRTLCACTFSACIEAATVQV
jgi:hypothetical protein